MTSSIYLTLSTTPSISFFLILFFSLFSFLILPASGDLQQVYILFRHGDRTPCHSMDLFPNDPNKFPLGVGQLTQIGKEGEYTLGELLNVLYHPRIIDQYKQQNVFVYSSDVDRTLMSAQCVLAGMFPPNISQRIIPELLWQPIPVHTIPKEYDFIFRSYDHGKCPKYDRYYENERKNTQSYLKAKEIIGDDLIPYLSGLYGSPWLTVDRLGWLSDVLVVEQSHQLPILNGMNESIVNRTILSGRYLFAAEFEDISISRLLTCNLFHNMISSINDFIYGENTLKVHLYSAHDSTVVIFLNSLGLFQAPHHPPYSSFVTVELHNVSQTEYKIRLEYNHNTLYLPFCSNQEYCDLNIFLDWYQKNIPKDFQKGCSITNEPSSPLNPLLIPLIISLILIFVVIFVAIIWVRAINKKHYEPLLPETEHPIG